MSLEQSLDRLTAEDFRENIGVVFSTRSTAGGGAVGVGPSDPHELQLSEVTEHPEMAAGSLRAPFDVVFHGPLEPLLPQGNYLLKHDRLGALELFLVPIGPDNLTAPEREPTAMRYEAVFG